MMDLNSWGRRRGGGGGDGVGRDERRRQADLLAPSTFLAPAARTWAGVRLAPPSPILAPPAAAGLPTSPTCAARPMRSLSCVSTTKMRPSVLLKYSRLAVGRGQGEGRVCRRLLAPWVAKGAQRRGAAGGARPTERKQPWIAGAGATKPIAAAGGAPAPAAVAICAAADGSCRRPALHGWRPRAANAAAPQHRPVPTRAVAASPGRRRPTP
jgi:hypothetical protein